MGKVRRLSSEEVKEVLHRDELGLAMEKGAAWVRSHVENVVIGAVVLAAAVFGLRYYLSSREERALEAAKLLAEAEQLYQRAGSLDAAAAPSAFTQAYAKYQGVAQSYEGTPQAFAGRLGMANALFSQGKFDEALREYQALAADKGAGSIAAIAGAGAAACEKAKGQSAAAAKPKTP